VRRDHYQAETALHLDQLFATSSLLSEITGIAVAPNKAVVGANAFAHEAGIHQDGILKNPLTYQVISPEAVGVTAHKLVLGKHSGRNALRSRLTALGITLIEEEHGRCYRLAMALADIKKVIDDDDIRTAVWEADFVHIRFLWTDETFSHKEEKEFAEIYNLHVVEIPTNVPVVRKDENDLIFKTKGAKFDAAIMPDGRRAP
jgi:isopropylmalate/homocitrate/citramalate synthase